MSAVDKLAEAIHQGSGCLCGLVATPGQHTATVLAAIRAMSPDEQAELIGGRTEVREHVEENQKYARTIVLGTWQHTAIRDDSDSPWIATETQP